jgi:DNA modification methylase
MENTKSLLLLGNCLDRLKDLEENSIDAICTDPPYGLAFMGKRWDYDVPSVEIWKECLRVLKPGGSLLSFAGTRTQHRMAINIEDAGFVLKDIVYWVYGCLSEDTLAMTPEGPKTYKDLRVGDPVIGYNIDSGLTEKVEIQEIVEYDYDEDAYLIGCIDGAQIGGIDATQLVSRNHRVICLRDGKLSYVMAEFLNDEEKIPFYVEGGMQVMQDVKISKVPYKGKVWCLRVQTGAFVAVRNGVAFPTGNSGFPKSLNVSKAIDKMLGAERKVVGMKPGTYADVRGANGIDAQNSSEKPRLQIPITEAGSDEAKKWEGFGTALKPAYEPITWAIKPPLTPSETEPNGTPVFKYCAKAAKKDRNSGLSNFLVFRFPLANLPANLSELNNLTEDDNARWVIDDKKENVMVICPKDNLDSLLGNLGDGTKPEGIDDLTKWEPLTNQHATVKPNELMRWLCQLVTPPGGTVLDPFMGSGSTGVAALQEGFSFIGIEMEPSYLEIAKLRISNI